MLRIEIEQLCCSSHVHGIDRETKKQQSAKVRRKYVLVKLFRKIFPGKE